MTKAQAREHGQDSRSPDGGDRPDLDHCYGRIGISAVAAALRYQGRRRSPALRVTHFDPYDRD